MYGIRSVYQEEDEQGFKGLKISRDLMEVGGEALKTNITTLGPLVLPFSEQLLFFAALIRRTFSPAAKTTTTSSSATAKISVDASLAGAIIGKGGVSSKQICRQTGAKLSIQDHERDPNLKNIELEGTFEQINEASVMVRELIGRLNSAASRRPPGGGGGIGGGVGSEGKPHPGSNFKTKMCERFAKGNCTFGDRCHFAHGEAELRRSGIA